MRRRVPLRLWMILMIVLMASLPDDAAAQKGTTAFAVAGVPADIEDVKALVSRPAVGARLYEVEGPKTVHAGDEARFHARANIDAVSLPIRAEWDFGDGTHAAGLHTVHRYTRPGKYTVTFSISNDFGSAVDTLVVEVLQGYRDTVSNAER